MLAYIDADLHMLKFTKSEIEMYKNTLAPVTGYKGKFLTAQLWATKISLSTFDFLKSFINISTVPYFNNDYNYFVLLHVTY